MPELVNTHVAEPAPCRPQLIPPAAADQALEDEGLLYLRQRSTDRRYNISTRRNPGSTRAPFHLNCTLPVSLLIEGGHNCFAHAQRAACIFSMKEVCAKLPANDT